MKYFFSTLFFFFFFSKGTSSTGKILWRVKLPLPATAIEFNPEGDTICCCMSIHGGSAGQVMLLNPMNGMVVHNLEHAAGVLNCTFQPVGVYGIPPLLATCGHNGMMNLFCASTLCDRSDLLTGGHSVHCSTCVFSPNGMYFVSGDCTGSVILRQFSFSKNKLTLVQKQRWNMGGPISAW